LYYEILRREGKSENSLLYNSILLSAFSISGADALRFSCFLYLISDLFLIKSLLFRLWGLAFFLRIR